MNRIDLRATSNLDSKDTICGPIREGRNALLPCSWGEYCYSWGHYMYANWSQIWYKKYTPKWCADSLTLPMRITATA